MSVRYAYLSKRWFPQLHATFMEAFADYFVDTSGVTERVLMSRAIKNGVEFDASVGAFDGDEMVAFTIVGIDRWKGAPAAFDIGTGVIPLFRGRGIARGMFDFASARLRERGVERFVLEVIQDNAPAVRAYKAAGFEIIREFDCCVWKPVGARVQSGRDIGLRIRPTGRDRLAEFEPHLDWRPSWENSFASLRRVPDDLEIFGAFETENRCVGLLVYYPLINWITTLVVKKDARRRGVATALLGHFASHAEGRGATVKMVNVDRSDRAMVQLVEKTGFELQVRQFEMEMNL